MFIDNFERICEIKGLKTTPILKECGISAGTATNWIKKRDVVPDGKTIVKLAEHLNVSTDYLLLGKEPTIPTEYQKLIESYQELSKDNQQLLKDIISSMINIQVANNNADTEI